MAASLRKKDTLRYLFLRRTVERYAALFGFVVVLLLWQFTVDILKVPSFIFPSPIGIAKSFYGNWTKGIYTHHVIATVTALVLGYCVGSIIGFVVGVVIAEIRVLEKIIYPAVVALQSMPKVAVAPLFVMWFGYGLSSKIVIVSTLCMFPVLVNTISGIKSADQDKIDMVRSLTGTPLDILYHVKLPSASDQIFAGLQIGVVMALIGAIVAEFVGSDSGLGIILQSSQLNLDTPSMFVVLIMLSVIGIISSGFVKIVQKRVIYWN